jgi:hypothetical protein
VVEVVVVLEAPAEPDRVVVVVCPVPPTPAPGRDVPVVVGEGDDVVVVVDVLGRVVVEVLGRVVVGVATVVDVGEGGLVVVVVGVGAGVTLVDPRHRPGARQTAPLPPLPDAAPELAGGYRYHSVPKPTKATTISRVDRRIGSRG